MLHTYIIYKKLKSNSQTNKKFTDQIRYTHSKTMKYAKKNPKG